MSILIKNHDGELLDVAWGNDPSEYDLSRADLRWADLRWANLSEANLCGANLSGANLYYLGNDSRGYQYFLYFEDVPIIRAGCRSFAMAQARAHWEDPERHESNPMLRAEILGKLDAADRIIAAHAAMGVSK